MQIATFFLFLIFFLIFFLNYISCLYTEQDLFQQDLSLIEKKEKKKLERLLFIFKNRQPFSLLVDFLQVIFGVFLTHFLDPWNKKQSLFVSLFITFTVSLLGESLARYVASKTKKKVLLNNCFLFLIYEVIKCSSFIFWILGCRTERITSNSELDIIRYVRNLTMDNIVEKKEAQLVQAAFNFDDLTMESIMTPLPRIIFLKKNMSYKEVKRIFFKNLFFYYPVLNERNRICGIFNAKKFCMTQKKKKWQNQIINDFLSFSYSQTLDKLLDNVEKNELTMAVIFNKNKMIGIITHKDMFNALIGNWKKKDRS